MTPSEADRLLDLAELAIRGHLDGAPLPDPELQGLPEALRRPYGAFVTLRVGGDLNGCIGNIDDADPIGIGVARLAVKAAFEDPRLPGLRHVDLERLHIEVSLLSPRTEVPASTREQLIEHLRPSVDGLIIESRRRRATYLPSVWEQLPDPERFVDQLLMKADMRGPWPDDMVAEVFTTSSFGRHAR